MKTVVEILCEAVDESEAEESSFGRSLKVCQGATLSLAERFLIIVSTLQRRPLQDVLSSPELNETVVRRPLVLSTQRSGSGAASTSVRKHMTSNVKIPSMRRLKRGLPAPVALAAVLVPEMIDGSSRTLGHFRLKPRGSCQDIYSYQLHHCFSSIKTKYDWVQPSSTPNRHHEAPFSLSTAPSST